MMTFSLPPRPAYRPYFSAAGLSLTRQKLTAGAAGLSLARPKLTAGAAAADAAEKGRRADRLSFASTVRNGGCLFGSGRSLSSTSAEKGLGRFIACSATKVHDSDARGIIIVSGKGSIHLAQKIATFLDAPLSGRDETITTACDAYILHRVCVDESNADMLEMKELIERCKFAKRVTLLLTDFTSKKDDADALVRARDELKDSRIDRLVLDRSTILTLGNLFTDFGPSLYTIDSTMVFRDYLQKKGLTSTVVVTCDWQPGSAPPALLLSTILNAKHAMIGLFHWGAFAYWKIVGEDSINEKTAVIIYQYQLHVNARSYTSAGLEDAGSLIRSETGAKNVLVFATHGCIITSASEVEVLSSKLFDEVVVTDASYIPEEYLFVGLKIISVAPMFADRIKFLHEKSGDY